MKKKNLVDAAFHKWYHPRSDLLDLFLGDHLKEAFPVLFNGVFFVSSIVDETACCRSSICE